MNLDWVASLFIVTLLVFGLVVVVEGEFSAFNSAYGGAAATGSVAQVVADHVDRLEGSATNATTLFDYASNPGVGTVDLPANLKGGPYTLDFTRDYVIVMIGGGTPVGRAVNFGEPVYLFNLSVVHCLDLVRNPSVNVNGSFGLYPPVPTSGCHQSSSPTSLGVCMGIVSGTDFLVTHERARVDGQIVYLTIISSADGLTHAC